MTTFNEDLISWGLHLTVGDIPESVLIDAKLRILDVLGTSLAATSTDVARSFRDAALSAPVAGGHGSHVIGFGDETSPANAALVNGTLAHILDFDDTHNETVIHVSAPIVATAVTLGEAMHASGTDVLVAVVAGREATCRWSLPAPGAFHERGFHATGLFGALGAALTAARVLGLDDRQSVSAVGVAGSQAAGLLEFFADGSSVKRMHPGWAAHSGIWAASLAAQDFTGPATVVEGRYGLFNSHLGERNYPYERITAALGTEWTTRATSFKPYPCGHVIHQFIDAVTLLRRSGATFDVEDISRVTCRVAGWMIPIVCEPVDVKQRPSTDYQAKFSLQYSLAAALVLGELGIEAYTDARIADPRILTLAAKVGYEEDEEAPCTSQFKGWVIIETVDGRVFEQITDANRGSIDNPLTSDEIGQKFTSNAHLALDASQAAEIVRVVDALETLDDVSSLVDLCISASD